MTTASQVEALSGELNVFFGKNPLESKDLSSIINAYHFDRLMKLLNDVSRENIVHGGQWDRANLWVIRCGLILLNLLSWPLNPQSLPWLYMQWIICFPSCSKIVPTILLDAPEDSLVMNEEIFGPLLPIVTVTHTNSLLDSPLSLWLWSVFRIFLQYNSKINRG